MPFIDLYGASNSTVGTTTWPLGLNNTSWQLPPYRPVESLWSDLRERDRFYLAQAREIEAPLLSTPTRDVRPSYVVRHRRLSGWLRKAERHPLNKRALSRR